MADSPNKLFTRVYRFLLVMGVFVIIESLSEPLHESSTSSQQCFSKDTLKAERNFLTKLSLEDRRKLICEGKFVQGRKTCNTGCTPSLMMGSKRKSDHSVVFLLEALGWGNVAEAFSTAWVLASFTNRPFAAVINRGFPKGVHGTVNDLNKTSSFIELVLKTYPTLRELEDASIALEGNFTSARDQTEALDAVTSNRAHVHIRTRRAFLHITSDFYESIRGGKSGQDRTCSHTLSGFGDPFLSRAPMVACGLNYLVGNIDLSSPTGLVLSRLEWNTIDLAIHIRLGNRIIYGGNSTHRDYRLHGVADYPELFPWREFFRCIYNHARERNEAKRIYVASDWDGVFPHAHAIYRERLVKYPRDEGKILLVTDVHNKGIGDDIRAHSQAMTRVLAEHAILSAAKLTYYPGSSSYSDTAVLASLVPHVHYKFTKGVSHDNQSCPIIFV